jgi:hypothetical protein
MQQGRKFLQEVAMCRERKLYTASSDPYCRFIKQFFSENAVDYLEVDISRNEAEFHALLNIYGTGPLPVLVEDGKIISLNQLLENSNVTFSGRTMNIGRSLNRIMHDAPVAAAKHLLTLVTRAVHML